jgi:uncharacterized membrane protein YfcA
MTRLSLLAPVLGLAAIAIVLATAGGPERGSLAAAALIAVLAGLSATSIGVFGAILVPGLLLLGLEPRVAAPLSLLLQVLVIPLGAGTHALVGHVRRSIAGPLIVGGAAGSVAGALTASSVPAEIAARAVAAVIVAVGLIVLVNLRSTAAIERSALSVAEPSARRVGAIGAIAGLASGLSGAGWGPIGVKLLILTGVEPRHAVGSSLVGRVAMAIAAIAAYGLTAAAIGALRIDPKLFLVLLAGSAGSIVPGASLIGRLGRQRAAAAIALVSIALALPTVIR